MSCSSGTLKKVFNTKSPKKAHTVTRKYVTGPTDSDQYSFFKDRTADYGLSGLSATQIYAVDFDNDGKTDLVLMPDYFSIPRFLRNDGTKFVELDYFPFEERFRSSFLTFVDINKDGLLDVASGTLNQKSELRPEPIRIFLAEKKNNQVYYYEQKSIFPYAASPAASFSFLDFDLDGNLDLFIANWFKKINNNFHPVPDELYHFKNNKFINASTLLNDEHKINTTTDIFENATPSFGAGICDIDQNGRVDILVSSSSGYQNKLWLNLTSRGKLNFIDFGKESQFAHDNEGLLVPRGGGNSFFSICSDYNNDGIMDIVQGELFHVHDSENRDRSSILTGIQFNFPPKFLRTEYHLDDGTDSWTGGDRRGSWIDFNNDGLLDIVVDNSGFPPKSRLLLFEQLPNHGFVDIARDLGLNILNPSGTVLLDINGDGKMDILSGQSNIRNSNIIPRLYLFQNEIPTNNNRSLRVYLRGKNSNTKGIGATLKVLSNKKIQMRFVEYTNGPNPSQNEEGIHFGLGEDKLESIEVLWPYSKLDQRPEATIYNLKKINFKQHLEITLCESGKFLMGKKNCL